jgi:hypothetical protein
MTGRSEGALPDVTGRTENLTFHFEKWQSLTLPLAIFNSYMALYFGLSL